MVLVVCSSFMSFVPNFANNWKDPGFTYLWLTTKVLSSKSMNVEISSLWYVTKILYDQPNELLPIFLPNNYKIPEFVLLFPHKQSWYAYGCIEYKCLILCFPEDYQHFLSNLSFFLGQWIRHCKLQKMIYHQNIVNSNGVKNLGGVITREWTYIHIVVMNIILSKSVKKKIQL